MIGDAAKVTVYIKDAPYKPWHFEGQGVTYQDNGYVVLTGCADVRYRVFPREAIAYIAFSG